MPNLHWPGTNTSLQSLYELGNTRNKNIASSHSDFLYTIVTFYWDQIAFSVQSEVGATGTCASRLIKKGGGRRGPMSPFFFFAYSMDLQLALTRITKMQHVIQFINISIDDHFFSCFQTEKFRFKSNFRPALQESFDKQCRNSFIHNYQ